MKVLDVFSQIKADLTCVGLIQERSFPHYFCTPLNAVIFASIGVDGIHFCIVPEEDDRTLERSAVYVVSPMMPEHYVFVVAENFYDFISLVVSVKYAGLLECISYFERERFLTQIQEVEADDLEVKTAIEALTATFPTRVIDDVYGYVRQVQAKMDLSAVQFSDEYYEIVGLN